jgi:elongation factor Tu
VVAVPGTCKPYSEALVSMYVLTEEEGGRKSGFGQNYRPQIFLRTADEAADLKWPEGTEDTTKLVMPGDNVEMVLRTHHPLAMEAGNRFNIREGGKTVATGLITRVIK